MAGRVSPLLSARLGGRHIGGLVGAWARPQDGLHQQNPKILWPSTIHTSQHNFCVDGSKVDAIFKVGVGVLLQRSIFNLIINLVNGIGCLCVGGGGLPPTAADDYYFLST